MHNSSEPRSPVLAQALLVGTRINLRQTPPAPLLARNPHLADLPGGTTAVLLRFGVVVFFNATADARTAFIAQLAPLISEPTADRGPSGDDLVVQVDAGYDDELVEGVLRVPELDAARQQVIADVLAKSALLTAYEESIGSVFDRIDPLAENLHRHGRGSRKARELVRHIGATLLTQHRMVGRAEMGDKPEILWERPELERLFFRLEQEFEIKERSQALERKLDVIATTAGTLLDLLHTRQSLRVEWYIVILIVVEILLTLYELFFHTA